MITVATVAEEVHATPSGRSGGYYSGGLGPLNKPSFGLEGSKILFSQAETDTKSVSESIGGKLEGTKQTTRYFETRKSPI